MAASRFATFLESFDADPKRRGTQWEHVCKWFLETDPVYRAQLKKVWLWNKWPGKWGPDAGIDLVAQDSGKTRRVTFLGVGLQSEHQEQLDV